MCSSPHYFLVSSCGCHSRQRWLVAQAVGYLLLARLALYACPFGLETLFMQGSRVEKTDAQSVSAVRKMSLQSMQRPASSGTMSAFIGASQRRHCCAAGYFHTLLWRQRPGRRGSESARLLQDGAMGVIGMPGASTTSLHGFPSQVAWLR